MLCKLSRITLIAFILYAIQVHSFDDALARSDSGGIPPWSYRRTLWKLFAQL